MVKNQNSIHWQAFEYEHRERSPDWFWAVGIITIALSVTAIILHNVLFAFVIILSGFVLSLYAARPPKEIGVVIDDRGVRVEKTFYPFHSLESFWLEEMESGYKILLKSQRLLMPYIVIPLGEADPEEVHSQLRRHLPEIFHSESSLQKLMEYLGF
jgi:hypothetical protein